MKKLLPILCVVSAGIILTGCSSGSGSGAATPKEIPLPSGISTTLGPPPTGATQNPVASGYVGLTQAEAQEKASAENNIIRVISVDGKDYPMTMDYNPNRVNLTIVNDKVVAATYG